MLVKTIRTSSAKGQAHERARTEAETLGVAERLEVKEGSSCRTRNCSGRTGLPLHRRKGAGVTAKPPSASYRKPCAAFCRFSTPSSRASRTRILTEGLTLETTTAPRKGRTETSPRILGIHSKPVAQSAALFNNDRCRREIVRAMLRKIIMATENPRIPEFSRGRKAECRGSMGCEF
jgi:hypothetical protein